MEENKEILELLKQIEKTNRKQVRNGRILCGLTLVAVLCCVVTFVMVFGILTEVVDVLPQINTVITQIQTVLTNLEQTTGQLAELDLVGMVSDVDMLVTSTQQTMEKLNGMDFEALNQAIKDLAAVVEPLAKVSRIF